MHTGRQVLHTDRNAHRQTGAAHRQVLHTDRQVMHTDRNAHRQTGNAHRQECTQTDR